jgi:predicted nucleic acid-binding protein
MIVSFDTNVLVYATARGSVEKNDRALAVIDRGMRGGHGVLLLQTLAEFSSVALSKAKMPVGVVRVAIDDWRAVFPVYPAEPDDLLAALEAVKTHRLALWDALLWATARRVGVRCMLTEDMQDGFQLGGVKFINPFHPANAVLIDEMLPS